MDESGEEDLFADNVDEYEDDPPLLPPPVIPTASGAARTIATDDVPGTQGDGQDKTVDTPQQKRKIRKPLLTLKVDRLFGENGIPYLTREFPKLKFKGKGHEASDLKYLLKQYELWGNRVYPKYTFTDFIKRVETLGSKSKEFKTQFRNMRYRSAGIPVAGEGEEEEEEEELMITNQNTEPAPSIANNSQLVTDSLSSSPTNNSLMNVDRAATGGGGGAVTSSPPPLPLPPDLWDVNDTDPTQVEEENPYNDIDDLLDNNV